MIGMFGIKVVGGEYDGMFASQAGLLTREMDEVMVFRFDYWAKHICYMWNKNGDDKYIPVEFYISMDGELCHRELKCPED